MLKREIAKRVFAKEFEACRELDKSERPASETADSKSPNLLISSCLILNRVFAVGVLTELDSIGLQNEMWKARIVDPTGGAFTVYAGQFQPDASIFFSTVQVPAFIALTGKARIYEPEPGSVLFLSGQKKRM